MTTGGDYWVTGDRHGARGPSAGQPPRGLPVGSRFVGTPRVGFSASEYGQDYRARYGLGVLDRGNLNFELGVDALRRDSPLQGGTSTGVLGRASLGW